GGGALAASLLRARLVDEMIVFSAGKVIGAEGRAGIGPLALDGLAQAPGFELVETRALGGDVMHRWRRVI
ncbi:RibD family protein, partial [Saccharopolyspora hordei]|uniref:RibD family protein n=1 Tax=Saccharopolyspora hordei TaxID=1838 RepID=UPI0035F0823B